MTSLKNITNIKKRIILYETILLLLNRNYYYLFFGEEIIELQNLVFRCDIHFSICFLKNRTFAHAFSGFRHSLDCNLNKGEMLE